MRSKVNLSIAIIITLFALSNQGDKNGKFCPTHRMKHPTDCKLFFYCVNITKPQRTYVWVPGKCQLGLVFQPILGMCVIPEEYEECQGENDAKMTIEMVQDIVKNQQQLLAEEPNLEYEVTLEPKLQPPTQTSSHFGGIFDHGFDTNSRLSSLQELNKYYSYKPMQQSSSDKQSFVNQGIDNKRPGSIPPTGSIYPIPEKYKIKGGDSQELSPTYYSKYSSDYNWNDMTGTKPPFFTQSKYQHNAETLGSNSKNDHERPNNMNTQQFALKDENFNYKNSNDDDDESENHGNDKNIKTKNQNGFNETNKNLLINQRDTMNHTKSTAPVEITTPAPMEQQEIPRVKISNRQGGVGCKNRVRQPHISDCTKYYICNSKGELTSYNCPYRTAFNAYTQKCDGKVYDDCLKQIDSGPGTVTNIPLLDDIDLKPQDQLELSPQVETREETFICTNEGKFPDSTSIHHYYMCSLEHGTQALLQHRLLCPQKLLFCSEKKLCTYAEECYQ